MATQEIICDRVHHIPVNQVQSIQGPVVTPKEGYSLSLLRTQYGKVTSKTEATTAGPQIKETLEIICPAVTILELRNLQNAHQVFVLKTSQGRTLLFGDLDNPARFSASESQLDPTRMIFTVNRK
jgi:hypothetical protein